MSIFLCDVKVIPCEVLVADILGDWPSTQMPTGVRKGIMINQHTWSVPVISLLPLSTKSTLLSAAWAYRASPVNISFANWHNVKLYQRRHVRNRHLFQGLVSYFSSRYCYVRQAAVSGHSMELILQPVFTSTPVGGFFMSLAGNPAGGFLYPALFLELQPTSFPLNMPWPYPNQ